MLSSIPILDRTALEGLHTGSLLARLRRLQECEEEFALSDRAGAEAEPDRAVTGQIEFKNTAAWVAAYQEVKEVLATREHLPTAVEREMRRKKGER